MRISIKLSLTLETLMCKRAMFRWFQKGRVKSFYGVITIKEWTHRLFHIDVLTHERVPRNSGKEKGFYIYVDDNDWHFSSRTGSVSSCSSSLISFGIFQILTILLLQSWQELVGWYKLLSEDSQINSRTEKIGGVSRIYRNQMFKCLSSKEITPTLHIHASDTHVRQPRR